MRVVIQAGGRGAAARTTVRFSTALILTAIFGALAAHATDFVTISSGDWFSPKTWSPAPYPYAGDNATISNETVYLTFYNVLDLQVNNLNFFGGRLLIQTPSAEGNLTMTGADSTWNHCQLTVDATHPVVVKQAGTLRLIGDNYADLGGGTFMNLGSIGQTNGSSLNFSSGAVVNGTDALFDMGNGNINAASTAFTNYGAILKSSGTNTSSIVAEFNNQGGLIEVDSGTLVVPSSTASSNGTFIVSAGATLDLTYNDNTLWTGELSGSGAGQVTLQYGSLNSAGNLSLTLNLPDGMFQWSSGTMGGTVTNSGAITLSGGNSVSLNALINGGLFRHTNTAVLSVSAAFENSTNGVYDAEGAGRISGGAFENFGLLQKSGSGTFSVAPQNFDNNGGTVLVNGGILNFSTFIQSNGITRVPGGDLSGGPFNFIGGTFNGGVVEGNIVNAATVIPGNNGLGFLFITGNYQQNDGGTLDIALSGTGPGAFGELIASGSASLSGALNLMPTNNYVPSVGDKFQILSCSSLSGTFSLPATFPTGMELSYSNDGVFLTVTGAVLWPAQLNPPATGNGSFDLGFQTVYGQSYTVQTNDALTTTNWGDFTNFTGDGSEVKFAVPTSNGPERFFRLREP